MTEPIDRDYDRIWLEPRPGDPAEGREWCSADHWSGNPDYAADGPPTEYIRADLVEARIAAAHGEGRREAMQWRPIETAPKDDSRILILGTEGGRAIAFWDPEGTSWADEHGNPCAAGEGSIQVTGIWMCEEDGWFQPNEARGWFPLPPAPKPDP